MLSLSLLSVFLLVSVIHAKDHHCFNSYELRIALRSVLPGDDIVLHASGNPFRGHFYATEDATQSQPITIRSDDPDNRAIIRGLSLFSYDAALYVTGNYWTITNVVVENGNKGIVYDNAIGGKILNCHVRNTGEEAIHIRDGSSQFLIENNVVENTGLVTAGYGEGIYIGSDKSVHNYFNPTVSFVTIRNNRIGPNVRAEAMDIREGTHDIMIEDNVFDARGLSGQNSADSFIDLKGSHCVVRNNVFNQNGATRLKKGVNAIDRGVDKSSFDHVIIDNVFNLEDGTSPMVQANRNTQNIYVVQNTRHPAGSNYGGSVVENRVPDWYTAMLGRNPLPSPTSLATPSPTPSPTLSPSLSPTPSPTPSPTSSPTPRPSLRPVQAPTPPPTPRPTMPPQAGNCNFAGTPIFTSAITETTALITWSQVADSASFTLRLKQKFVGDSWTTKGSSITGSAFFLSGLTPFSMYSVEVQILCTNGAYSEWSDTTTFHTLSADSQQVATSPPTQSPVDISQAHVIYANWQVNGDFWKDESENGSFYDSYNDGGSHRSSFFAELQPRGMVKFVTNTADLSGLREVRFFVRSLGSPVGLRLRVNGVAGAITAGEEWRDHTFNFSYWVSGSDVTSISFENRNDSVVKILLDDIRFMA